MEINALSPSAPPRPPQKVAFWERAFAQGKIIGVNGYHVNQAALERCFTEAGYRLHALPHFWVGTREQTPTLVVHWLAPTAIDADLGRTLLEELKPPGLLADTQDFAAVFGAVVGSLFPHDPERAWHLFGANTLRRYHQLLAGHGPPAQPDSHIACFATLYRRVCELVVGESLLEAGCSFGFFPLMLAERQPTMRRIIGVDRETDPFPVARALAAERHLPNVQFTRADLLTDDLRSLGLFPTVTALHVLEHFRAAEMYRVLTALFQVTTHRLILAVPYEPGEPEAVYGHEQRFSRARLQAVGRWCQEQLGAGQVSYEDCVGGLLIVERAPCAPPHSPSGLPFA